MISIYLTLVCLKFFIKILILETIKFSGEHHLASKPCRFKRKASEKSNT